MTTFTTAGAGYGIDVLLVQEALGAKPAEHGPHLPHRYGWAGAALRTKSLPAAATITMVGATARLAAAGPAPYPVPCQRPERN